ILLVSGQGGGRIMTLPGEVLPSISVRCVECSALYPVIEAGRSGGPLSGGWVSGRPLRSPLRALPRYRCDCGGVLDVEMQFKLPEQYAQSPLAGTAWRQLFDERAARPPVWPLGADSRLLDYSGVWRYRELILPVPEEYIVSRPEGNTGLYPVGIDNCGPRRSGHRPIGIYAGLEHLFVKHEG